MILQGARRRRRRRTGLWLALGLALAGAALFAIGVAVGEALHDNPSPGGSATYVRTLHPRPITPTVHTFTVTTGAG